MNDYSYTSLMLQDLRSAVGKRNERCIYRWAKALSSYRSISKCVKEMIEENALMLRLELVRWVRENAEVSETGDTFYLHPDGHRFRIFDNENDLDHVKRLTEDLNEMRAYIDVMVESIIAGECSTRSRDEWVAFFLDHFVEGMECAKYSDDNQIGLLELCLSLGMNVNRTRHLLIRVLGEGDLNFKSIVDIVWAYGLQAKASYAEVCDLISWAEKTMADGRKRHKLSLTPVNDEEKKKDDPRYDLTQWIIDQFDGDDDPFAKMGEFDSRAAFKNWLKPMLPDLKSANGGSRTATLVYRRLVLYWYELVERKEKGEIRFDLWNDLSSTPTLAEPVDFGGREAEILEKLLPEEAKGNRDNRSRLFGTITKSSENAVVVDLPADRDIGRSKYKHLKELLKGDGPVQKKDLLLVAFFICCEVWDKEWSAKQRWELFYDIAHELVLPDSLLGEFYLPALVERSISLAICNMDVEGDSKFAYYLLLDSILEGQPEKKRKETVDDPIKKEARKKDCKWLKDVAEETWQKVDFQGFDKALAEYLKKRFRDTGHKPIKFEMESEGMALEVNNEKTGERLDFPSSLRLLMENLPRPDPTPESKCIKCKAVLSQNAVRINDIKRKDLTKKKKELEKGKEEVLFSCDKDTFYCIECLAPFLDYSVEELREECDRANGLSEGEQARYLFASKLLCAVETHFRKDEIKCTIDTKGSFTMTFKHAHF